MERGVLGSRCTGAVQILAAKTGATTSCGKTTSTRFTGSTKHEQNLHENVKPLQLATNGSSRLAYRSPVLEHQWNLSASSSSANVVTTFDDDKGVSSSVVEEKIGVLLLNLGGPETLDDVQPFLFNLFADPDIIRLPRLFRFLQRPLAKLIYTFRASKSKEGYASIGGGSPLRKITDEQANALKIALEKKILNANIYVGMRYWYPFTEEAIDQIKKDKISKLVVLPLYPQYSISTSGSSIRVLQNIVKEDSYFSDLPISIIESWYQRDGYVKSMTDLIEKELSAFSNPEEVMIFFSAHGVPLTYVEDAGDPYRDQMEDCISLIMGELRYRGILNGHTLAYQSRVGPVQWLKPYTDEVLVELGQNGVKSLLAVPVSFVSEHIETLEEIDMEYKELALESGIENWGRVPALGCTSTFISDLADAVVEALPSASALATRKPEDTDSNMDLMHYLTKMFFGSILAFILLLSPRLVSAFRNTML
ncbi:ferrochelatase-1, chloroplastic-like isoform X2 [Miscanthus floridulus]|uniref:ferrochelatase-1, chloroplastic-like isoform X2 n=1 Tax=Miscanthus floridulus TaxID=154761 RepID=UPI0034579FC3